MTIFEYKTASLVSLLALLFSSAAYCTDTAEWQFQLAPAVLWGPGVNGDTTLGTSAHNGLRLNFQDDSLDDIDTTFGARIEAKKNQFTLFSEYQYIKLNPKATTGPLQIDLDFKSIMLELGATFVFSDTGSTTVESLFGFRYMDQQVKSTKPLQVSIPIALPPGEDIKGGDHWWQPFMGMQLGQRLGEHWSLLARADFAYAGSDNKASNASALINFQFSRRGSIFAGYRYINFDYNQGDGKHRYAFQADQQGPLLGFNVSWE